MEKETTNSDNGTLTEEQLRNAGASATYIAYYQAAQRMGEETASTQHAERIVQDAVSYSGGGFHDSLWEAEPRYPNNTENPYGADSQNMRILTEAGVSPYSKIDPITA